MEQSPRWGGSTAYHRWHMAIHLRGSVGDYAPAVLVPGDPKRARTIAETFFDDARCVNDERGMLGYTGTYKGVPLSVQSVGMGGPSAAIYYEELIQLGAQRIVRVGTAGGLHQSVRMGDTVLGISATADCGMSSVLLGGEAHAPTATWKLVAAAAKIADGHSASLHIGPIVTSSLFYDTRPGQMERWRDRGHLAVEMETSTLYTMAAIHGIEAVALMTVSDMIAGTGVTERITDDELAAGVQRMMTISCDVAIS
jgi:DeoD family purine-nucleoside phosphorylase